MSAGVFICCWNTRGERREILILSHPTSLPPYGWLVQLVPGCNKLWGTNFTLFMVESAPTAYIRLDRETWRLPVEDNWSSTSCWLVLIEKEGELRRATKPGVPWPGRWWEDQLWLGKTGNNCQCSGPWQCLAVLQLFSKYLDNFPSYNVPREHISPTKRKYFLQLLLDATFISD